MAFHLTEQKIPPSLQKYVKMQLILENANDSTVSETAQKLLNITESKLDHEEIAMMIIRISEARPLLLGTYSKICSELAMIFGKTFTYTLFQNSRRLFMRLLYLNGLFTLKEIMGKIPKNTELAYFFLPETNGYIVKDDKNIRFQWIRRNMKALKANDWALYKEYLEYGYDRNSIGYAIKYDDVSLLSKLLEKRGENKHEVVQVAFFEGYGADLVLTACAAFYGSEKSFDFLLLNDYVIGGEIGQFAVRGGSMNIVKKIQNNDVSFKYRLDLTVKYHRTEIFDYIYNNGPELLFFHSLAVSSENILAFIFLYNKKVEFDINSLMVLAANSGCLSICRFLLDNGADINYEYIENKNRRTLLQSAAIHDKELITEFLIKNGANINLSNNKGWTPLHYACKHDYDSICKRLLDNNAQYEVKDEKGCTPLYIAAQNGSIKCCELLLSKKAKVDSATNSNQTPLFIATKEKHSDVCKLLVAHGACVSICSNISVYPLHYACDDMELIKLYLKHGADVNCKTLCGQTPLSWCSNPACASYLSDLAKQNVNHDKEHDDDVYEIKGEKTSKRKKKKELKQEVIEID